jgi:hypothetical protein
MSTDEQIEILQRTICNEIYTREKEHKVVILHPDTYQLMLLHGSPDGNLYCFAGKAVFRSYDVEPFDFELY